MSPVRANPRTEDTVTVTDAPPTRAVPTPGDIITLPHDIRFRVDRVLYSRQMVASENVVDGLGSYRLDGQRGRVILEGDVVPGGPRP